uniref:Uncharacterized protein n=1 Tax=Mustela putorius furo TaxID=9669 RepID=M3YRA5_MUSPF
MWALLLFMVPSRRRLLPGSGRHCPVPGIRQQPGRLQQPAPASTKSRPLHLRPPQAVAQTPRAPNRGSSSPARPGALPGSGAEGEGRRPVSEAAQVPSAREEAALRRPQSDFSGTERKPGRRTSRSIWR